jgi:acetylornithine/N-succinyldiaminopimelate aminotransferase
MTNQELHNLDQNYYLQTFKRFPVAFDHGKGSKLYDVEGKEYIDALAGIAVCQLGHAHPVLTEVIQKQAAKMLHISNFFVSEAQVMLSKKLVELSGLNRVFFSNSGAESVEGAIKIARKYAHSVGRGGKVLSVEGSFHGRTLATIATGKKAMQNGFEPIPSGFEQIPFNDIESVKNKLSNEVGAIIVEPIQGEGGINMHDPQYLMELKRLCDRENIVLIFDEVQCGIGRTGHWFAKDHFKVQPDIISLAKGLGGGVPMGAILSNEKVASAIDFGDHGTTFGGNPLACSSALAVLEVIEKDGLLKRTRDIFNWFSNEVNRANLPGLKKIKGTGLMIGLELEFETKPLVIEMLKQGVIANATAGNILRLVPPLVITQGELAQVIKVIKSSIEKIK